MNYISDIISTPVISLYEGDYLGIVYNIMFDYKQKKCNYACIINDEDSIPHLIKFKDIFKIGKSCIYIKNKSSLNLELNCEKEIEYNANPLNLKVFDLECNFLGTSQDVVIDENFYLSKLILNNGKEISKEDIFNIGKSAIIIGNSKISIQKLKPIQKVIKQEKNEQKVVILNNILDSPNLDNLQNNKIITDFRFLIGRIINKDILALNGELIAKKNSVITKDLINKASHFGKLVEITRYSK